MLSNKPEKADKKREKLSAAELEKLAGGCRSCVFKNHNPSL